MIMKRTLIGAAGAAFLLLFALYVYFYTPMKRVTPGLADFAITVQVTGDRVQLTCSKGCAWTELNWHPADEVQGVDEYGMSND